MTSEIYHEKQHLQFCAVHAINNLFQDGTMCSKSVLDDISYSLNPHRWTNPHRSMLGIGNYDINVIMSFLQLKGYDVVWFDKRKSVSCIISSEIYGVIVNTPSTLPLLGRYLKHWYGLRKLHDQLYYNLDSKLSKPIAIGDEVKLLQYLQKQLEDGQRELLLVVEMGKEKQEYLTPEYFEK